MTPLEEAERISFIRMNLNLNSKKLNEKQEFRIAAGPQSGNPRYLKTLLEDICVWGDYDHLDDKISKDLEAKNTSQLYEIVLSRLEEDYGGEDNIIEKLLSFV